MITYVVDNKGRLNVGRKFAGKMVAVEEVDDFAFRCEVVRAIPERELWLQQNPEALASVREGMRQAAAGEFAPDPRVSSRRSRKA